MKTQAEKLVEEARKLISPVMTKPDHCPFCGGYASLISEYDVESDQSFYYVYCTKCGVEQGYYSNQQNKGYEYSISKARFMAQCCLQEYLEWLKDIFSEEEEHE